MYFFKKSLLIIIFYGLFSYQLFAQKIEIYYGITIAKLQNQNDIKNLKKEFKTEENFITKVGNFYRFSVGFSKNFQNTQRKLKTIQKKYPSAYIQKYKVQKLLKQNSPPTELNSNSIIKSRKLFFDIK